MVKLRYCARCLYPETKPEIWFDENGVCSACLAFEARKSVDWAARAEAFDRRVREAQPDARQPRVAVPVSGGKDSTAQVVKCQELGYHVVAVNARTDILSDIGRRNLDNIGRLCDVIEIHPDDGLRRAMMRLALKEVGDWSWPEHVLIHAAPLRIADALGIPVVVYGELAQNEYGAGPKGTEDLTEMTRRWVEEFSGLLGLRVDDVQEMTGATDLEMSFYRFPEPRTASAIWMGQYFPWDGYENARIARSRGFETFPGHVEGSLYGYENLDNHATGARDYLRYLKYGYGRATDIASNLIRRGILTREDGVKIARERDGAWPSTCLGRPLEDILTAVGVTEAQFQNAVRDFTNLRLFHPGREGAPPAPRFRVE